MSSMYTALKDTEKAAVHQPLFTSFWSAYSSSSTPLLLICGYSTKRREDGLIICTVREPT